MFLRRACSRLAPRVLVAVSEAASTAESGAAAVLRKAAGTAVGSKHAAVTGLRQFRSSSVASSSIISTLKTEIEYEEQNYTQPEELKDGPPSPFALSDTPGDTHLTLTRKYGDEEISVDLMLNIQPDQEPYEVTEDEYEVDVSVLFNVSVIKGEKQLVFECTSDGSFIAIKHVSFEPSEDDLLESSYTGPVYEELDDELQADFQEYIRKRGIDENLGGYLLQLMHDKEQREYTNWLKNVHRFVKEK